MDRLKRNVKDMMVMLFTLIDNTSLAHFAENADACLRREMDSLGESLE